MDFSTLRPISSICTDKKLYTKVLWLALFTIFYNICEGLVSIILGIHDETLALFGFGVDSFIEVISGLGILQMVLRIRMNPNTSRSAFEIRALRITGWSFYGLTAGLILGAILNVIQNHKPETTFWGIVVSVVSILVMFWLYKVKTSYGKKLHSDPVIADGRCTLVCIYMSIVLLVSSLAYQLTGFGWIDIIGALGLAWFSYNEGKEALDKAKGKECSCVGNC